MLRSFVIDIKGNWDECIPLIKFSDNSIYRSSIFMAPFESHYCRRCRSLVGLFEVGDSSMLCPEMVYESF